MTTSVDDRRFFDRVPVGAFRAAPDGRILDANAAVAAILGLPDRVAVLDRNIADFLVDVDDRRRLLDRQSGGFGGVGIELRLQRADGRVVWARYSAHAVKDDDGQVLWYEGVLEDVTERRRAEDALAESDALLRAIVDTEPECVKVLGPDGTVVMMNRSGLAMLEAAALADVVGRSAVALVAPEHRDAFVALTREVMRGGSGQLEFEIVGLAGTRRWVESHAVPLRNRSDEITAVLAVTRDITERRRAEAATTALADLGRALSRSLDPETVAGLVADHVTALLAADSAAVYRPDDADALVLIATARLATDFYWAPRLAVGTGLGGLALRARRVMSSPDVLGDPRITYEPAARAAIASATHGALLAVPLAVQDRMVGVLVVSSGTGRVFTDDETALAQAAAAHAGVALENARLYANAERKRAQAEGLVAMARLLTESLDATTVAGEIVHGVLTLFGADFSGLRLLRPDGLLELVGSAGADLALGHCLAPGEGIAGKAFAEGRAVVTEDYLASPQLVVPDGLRQEIAMANLISGMAVPLRVRDRSIGALTAGRSRSHRYDAEAVEMLQAFADQAAIALDNAASLKTATARRREAEALADVARAVSLSLDAHQVAQRLVARVQVFFGASTVVLYALNRNSGESVELARLGTGRWSEARSRGGGPIGAAMQTRAPFVGADLAVEEQSASADEDDRAVLAVPVVVADHVVGALAVADRRGRMFSADDVRMAEALAGQAAIALENARLYADSRAAAQQLADVVASSPAVIYRLRADGDRLVPEWTSANAAALLGAGPQADADWWSSLVHADDREAVVRANRALFASDHATVEYRLRRSDGSERWVRDERRLRRSSDGRPVEAVGSMVDITERKRTEDALRQSEKVAAMGSLLAGVAHELNNPLAVILGQAELLQRSIQGPDAERVRRMAAAADRCVRIVRNFLALARQHPAERSRVALAGIVREALELLAYPLRLDGVEVRLMVPDDLPLLWVDAHQIHQLLVNLLTNAHQAMRPHGEPRRLDISATAKEGGRRVRLEIADTGPGIPAELRRRVFEPFFTTKAPGQGTGLGLSLCHGIVEAHGGTIEIDGAPGGGCLVRVELPVLEAPNTPAAADAPRRAVSGVRVLVVDDEPEIGQMLADALELDGHRVEIARNGALALTKIAEGRFDVLLCDVRMPEVDGATLYRRLVELGDPVVQRFAFLTGDALNAQSAMLIHQSGVPCLLKPFALSEVRRLVDDLLGSRDEKKAPRP